MNEEIAKNYIAIAYRTIRMVKEIQRGNRSVTAIAKKIGCSKQLAEHYLKMLTK